VPFFEQCDDEVLDGITEFDLNIQNILITGGNSGIGKETAKQELKNQPKLFNEIEKLIIEKLAAEANADKKEPALT
jgi:NADP-dependent 3-hydroxy acid dehydrogenase YdfG